MVKRWTVMVGLLFHVERKTLANDRNHGKTWAARSASWVLPAGTPDRHDLRDYIAFHRREEESGVLIVEEIGFSKTGE